MTTYTIFMFVYDEYKLHGTQFKNVNDFFMRVRVREIMDFYKNGTGERKVHYQYYTQFNMNVIDILQAFFPTQRYVPPYRLLLCKSGYNQYGLHRYGWKAVIQSFLHSVYSEDCFYDDFYYEFPGFEWVTYANQNRLNNYIDALHNFKSSKDEDCLSLPFMIFDDWLELSFSYQETQRKDYIYPFFSFLHNPALLNAAKLGTFVYTNSMVMQHPELEKVKSNLSFLVCLSKNHGDYVQSTFNLCTKRMFHPLELGTEPRFDILKFLHLPTKRIFNIGWWLRKYNIFLQLQNYSKTIVIKSSEGLYVENYIRTQIQHTLSDSYRLFDSMDQDEDQLKQACEAHNTTIVRNLSNEDYDQIFVQNIVFLHVYDAAANNIVLECIMNNTPILVNNIPAVVEYLGENYPFYFKNAADAQMKLDSMDIIIKTHEYLKSMNKTQFTYDYFNKTLNRHISDCIQRTGKLADKRIPHCPSP